MTGVNTTHAPIQEQQKERYQASRQSVLGCAYLRYSTPIRALILYWCRLEDLKKDRILIWISVVFSTIRRTFHPAMLTAIKGDSSDIELSTASEPKGS